MQGNETKAVCTLDPAIDTERMTLEEMIAYIHTRDFSKIEPYLNHDKRPTIYYVAEIPQALMESFVLNTSNEAERHRREW